jgi:peptide deformylase
MRSLERCVGIAAPQIGELVRVAVVDVSAHPKALRSHGLLVFVDPVLVAAEGEELGREGCLSIPDLTGNVRRATWVRVEARSAAGEPVVVDAEGFEARAIQHELDHLDGILFVDRVARHDDLFPRKRYGGQQRA